MTSAQLVLVSVTSALIAVFAMLVVATIRRARTKDEPSRPAPAAREEGTEKS